MGRYKRYLFLKEKIPRCTQWYRRKRQNDEETMFRSNSITQQKSVHEILQEERFLLHSNSDEKQGECMNSNQVYTQVPQIVSTRSSLTEVPTPSSTLVRETLPILSVLQSTCQDSDSIDSFSAESFQSFANVENQDKNNKDCNSKNTIIFKTKKESEYGTENESEYGTENESEYKTKNKSNLEEVTDCLRDKPILKNIKPCLVEDENYSISDKEEFIRELSSSDQETLCPCTKTAAADVMFMCLVLGLRHNLSWEAQIDILKIFNAIYGDNTIKVTKYSYFKLLDEERENISFHIYCPDCEIYLGKKDELKENKMCTNCSADINISKSSNFFISVSLESQLQKLTKHNDFIHAVMNHRFNRNKIEENALEDLYDGDEYKKHFEKGLLSSPYNFSYSFFTDGIHTEGFKWFHNGKETISKVIPLCCIADSVARYQLLNFQSFAAYYGCTFCYQKSERTRKGQRFTISIHSAEERTLDSIKKDLLKAYQRKDETNKSKRQYRGVKGFSSLMLLNFFNFTAGFVVDYMHNILLGVTKLHTELILQSTRKKFWHISENVGMDHIRSTIDERLLMIHPPSSITRTPRSIKDISKWKASEWRAWLLFYSMPCLKGLLKKKHINHFAMLSTATNILLQKSITREEVFQAHKLFLCYMYLFQKYFDKENMVYNIHLLSHICKGVLNWGPLWTHNSFLYEGQNRHLMQLYHSPSNVILQIARKFLIYTSIPHLCSKLILSQKTIEFSEKILKRNFIRFMRCGEEIILLGKGEKCSLSSEEEQLLVINGMLTESYLVYQKMIYKRIRYTCSKYNNNKLNNDSYILISSGEKVVIRSILRFSVGVKLIVQQLNVCESIIKNKNIRNFHIQKIDSYGHLKYIDVSQIKNQCIFIDVSCANYVCEMPFGCYGD
ncbi:uncharacterized protein [Linepithema humile]|uniref:uncharacterized protein isoform X2 n=1 Tax=Linepithema humile TaxID=83485 RepID=UPI00351EF6DD